MPEVLQDAKLIGLKPKELNTKIIVASPYRSNERNFDMDSKRDTLDLFDNEVMAI